MTTTKKPTKSELTAAFDAGVDARKDWNGESATMPECDYPEGPLLTAWSSGWKGRDDLEKTQAEQSSVSGDDQLIAQGHQVDDPHVVEHSVQLAQLMTAFDNHGVQIVEEQWRALSDNEQTVAAKWANDMRIGEARPCPEFLLKYATEALKAASVVHHVEQAEKRRLLVACTFMKPTAILPNGDDGEDSMKMMVSIPDSEFNRPSLAEDFLHGKRLGIEFSLRSSDPANWQPELPGMESQPEIIECVADVKGYSRTMKAYKFGFPIGTDLIDDNTAIRQYAKQTGSIRLTLHGDIPPKAPKVEPATAETVAKARPMPSGPSLFKDDVPESDDDSEVPYEQQHSPDGEFFSPAEYIVRSHVDGAQTIVSIGIKDEKYFGTVAVVFFNEDGDTIESDWGNPQVSADGSASLSLAVQKEIGTAISYLMQQNASAKCLKDLRDELKRLEDGGEPIPMPEE